MCATPCSPQDLKTHRGGKWRGHVLAVEKYSPNAVRFDKGLLTCESLWGRSFCEETPVEVPQ